MRGVEKDNMKRGQRDRHRDSMKEWAKGRFFEKVILHCWEDITFSFIFDLHSLFHRIQLTSPAYKDLKLTIHRKSDWKKFLPLEPHWLTFLSVGFAL